MAAARNRLVSEQDDYFGMKHPKFSVKRAIRLKSEGICENPSCNVVGFTYHFRSVDKDAFERLLPELKCMGFSLVYCNDLEGRGWYMGASRLGDHDFRSLEILYKILIDICLTYSDVIFVGATPEFGGYRSEIAPTPRDAPKR